MCARDVQGALASCLVIAEWISRHEDVNDCNYYEMLRGGEKQSEGYELF